MRACISNPPPQEPSPSSKPVAGNRRDHGTCLCGAARRLRRLLVPSTSSTATTNLNTARVAKSIEASVLSERHLTVKVICPTAVPQETGRTFICTATGHSTTKPSTVTTTPFTVTIQNNKGYVTYKGE